MSIKTNFSPLGGANNGVIKPPIEGLELWLDAYQDKNPIGNLSEVPNFAETNYRVLHDTVKLSADDSNSPGWTPGVIQKQNKQYLFDGYVKIEPNIDILSKAKTCILLHRILHRGDKVDLADIFIGGYSKPSSGFMFDIIYGGIGLVNYANKNHFGRVTNGSFQDFSLGLTYPYSWRNDWAHTRATSKSNITYFQMFGGKTNFGSTYHLANHYKTELKELLLFDRQLSSDEISLVQQYLNKKWKL